MTSTEQVKQVHEVIRELSHTRFAQGRAGNPRVSADMPIILDKRADLLLRLNLGRNAGHLAQVIAEQAMTLHGLTLHQLGVCGRIRQSAEQFLQTIAPSPARWWPETAREGLAEGELPFSNADILPVYGGSMEVRPRLSVIDREEHGRLVAWIQSVQQDYEALDDLGRISTEWTGQVISLARQVVGNEWSRA